MSDDMRIPAVGPAQGLGGGLGGRATVTSNYRARRAGPDSGMRWVMMGAAGIGGVLLVGMGGYALLTRHPAVTPVIEADTRPIRIKPDNPGGMQVAGADEISGDGASGSDKMAPPAETPAPQALRAQMQQAAPEAPAAAMPAPGMGPVLGAAPLAPSPLVANGSPGATPGALPGASPLPDTPARPGVGAKAGSPPPPARPAVAGSAGASQVQLGALPSEAAAQNEWKRLAKTMPDVLGGLQPTVQKTERDGKTFWRLRTGGFTDVAEATAFCGKLRAKGASCAIASF